jgi:hypothetical protein
MTAFLSSFITAQRISEKSGMHYTALVYKYYYETGKSLGPQGNTGWQTPDILSW